MTLTTNSSSNDHLELQQQQANSLLNDFANNILGESNNGNISSSSASMSCFNNNPFPDNFENWMNNCGAGLENWDPTRINLDLF